MKYKKCNKIKNLLILTLKLFSFVSHTNFNIISFYLPACEPNLCQNGASCEDSDTDKVFVCKCRFGFTGPKCQIKKGKNVKFSCANVHICAPESFN